MPKYYILYTPSRPTLPGRDDTFLFIEEANIESEAKHKFEKVYPGNRILLTRKGKGFTKQEVKRIKESLR